MFQQEHYIESESTVCQRSQAQGPLNSMSCYKIIWKVKVNLASESESAHRIKNLK